MRDISGLAKRFDAALFHVLPAPPRATTFSIARINAHFGITLPADLVEFARCSKAFGNWFASIGPDYESPNHIIRINSYWRRRRRTRSMPRNLVAINLGFDDDLDCLDVSSYDPMSGEYHIQYWSPGVESVAPSSTFLSYVETLVKTWEAQHGRVEA
jgi:hypothetical protein